MVEALAVKAFMVGIFSALPLLLGATASFFWRPGDRVIAFMMAVGSGALLAALTIDLVGKTLEKGPSLSLCFGCLIGGLLFIVLDLVVSDYGGFMRKAATTVYHVRRQKHRQYRKILSEISQTDLFKHLSTRDFKTISSSIRSQECKKGDLLFQPGDPSDMLRIIVAGEVVLSRPDKARPDRTVTVNQVFGHLAFVTGAPHTSVAKASADTSILLVPRQAFYTLVLNSSTLQQVMHRWLRSREMDDYLVHDHGMTQAQARQWADTAVQSLINRGRIPPAIVVDRRIEAFATLVEKINRVHVFNGLPPAEFEMVSNRLLHLRYAQGQAMFHHGDLSDRLFIIDQGEVSLIDARSNSRLPLVLQPADGFGTFSFITGARHTVSALANTETHVWVLRRADFDALLSQTQVFREQVRQFLKQREVRDYLRHRLDLGGDKAERFVESALKAIDQGLPLPLASALAVSVEASGSAAIAIWLGNMLDGIPESLVLGTSMIHAEISMSLVAGLFIANFPEALSSSAGMRQQGLGRARILVMWSSIVLITGIGATIGNAFFQKAQPFIFALIEGIAAGAMLTMIAQTMLPEAYFKGGSLVGFATLLGFLTALLTKFLN